MADFIEIEKIVERIKMIMTESGMKQNSFAEESNIAASSLSQMLSGNKLSIDAINKIVARWRDEYHPLWILLGEEYASKKRAEAGETLFEQAGAWSALGTTESTPQDSSAVLTLTDEIVRLREELRQLKAQRQVERIMVYYSDNSYEQYKAE